VVAYFSPSVVGSRSTTDVQMCSYDALTQQLVSQTARETQTDG